MQIEVRHIQQRGNSLYFRLAVPVDLQNHFGGRREISQTLQTTDPFIAFAKASELRDYYKNEFSLIRSSRTAQFVGLPHILPRLGGSVQAYQSLPPLSEVLTELLEARPCRYKTKLDRKSAINLLIDWHGDLPANRYTRHMLLDFRDNGMRRLPPNLNKLTEFKGMSVREIAKRNHAKVMTTSTVNLKLGHISTLFNFTVKHGYADRSPVVDLMLPMAKAPSKERDCYSQDQLQRLVNKLGELTGSGRDVRHQRFWVTLVGLFTGARLNEIAQLQINELVEVDGIHCFRITEDGDAPKSLKNIRSERLVPVHPELIDLGVLRYVEMRRKNLNTMVNSSLWFDASHYRDGDWGRKMSRWFNDVLRPAFLTDQEKADHQNKRRSYCYHSLRHSWIHQAQQAQMNPRIEMRLTGHADAFISEEHARYGKDMHPSILLKELIKLDYGLDLSAVRGRY